MVRRILLLIIVFAVAAQGFISAQFTSANVKQWIGTGTNEVVLVVDFNDSTSNDCWAWGYRFDGAKTAEDMLTEIAATDLQLQTNLAGGFLNDISFTNHYGVGGSPNYWNTFSGTALNNWVANMGLSTSLNNGDWFGCSYTGVDSLWNPLSLPENPSPAQPEFTTADIAFWVGSGVNEVVLIIDFNDLSGMDSWAWGYRFDGNKTAEDMLMEIAAIDDGLVIYTGAGFLNNMFYYTHQGIGGSPNYWNTFSGTGLTDWNANLGISVNLNDGDWFGCSYTDFDMATFTAIDLPESPNAAAAANSIASLTSFNIEVYPNPCTDFVSVSSSDIQIDKIELCDMAGRVLIDYTETTRMLDLQKLPVATYNLRIFAEGSFVNRAIVKQ